MIACLELLLSLTQIGFAALVPLAEARSLYSYRERLLGMSCGYRSMHDTEIRRKKVPKVAKTQGIQGSQALAYFLVRTTLLIVRFLLCKFRVVPVLENRLIAFLK